MNLISYKSKIGNFGDDLNEWLWPKIFGDDFFCNDNDIAFLGIGSILISNSDYIQNAEKHKRKIVFGSGVRSISQDFEFDKTWDIMFLRGPFSSLIVHGKTYNYITDSAYFLALTDKYKMLVNRKKKYKISVIPYYKSVDIFDWKIACDKLGWNLILPTGNDVESFIDQVSESEFVIAEAMHGAIIADILRVPWKRLRFNAHIFEGEIVSEFKWRDWLYSIDIQENNSITFKKKTKRLKYYFLKKKYRNKNIKNFVNRMNSVNTEEFNISSNIRFESIISELQNKSEELKRKYS